MRLLSSLIAVASAGLFAASAAAQPIYLRPGQCILIGGSEVCAMNADGMTSEPKTVKTNYTCRLGMHADSEVGAVKTYAVIQTIVNGFGKKTESSMKNFGNNDKEGCEKEAKRLADEEKAEAKK